MSYRLECDRISSKCLKLEVYSSVKFWKVIDKSERVFCCLSPEVVGKDSSIAAVDIV